MEGNRSEGLGFKPTCVVAPSVIEKEGFRLTCWEGSWEDIEVGLELRSRLRERREGEEMSHAVMTSVLLLLLLLLPLLLLLMV